MAGDRLRRRLRARRVLVTKVVKAVGRTMPSDRDHHLASWLRRTALATAGASYDKNQTLQRNTKPAKRKVPDNRLCQQGKQEHRQAGWGRARTAGPAG